MMNIYQIEPNKWVSNILIEAITGLTDRQIKEYRMLAWKEGIHFKHASPSGSKGRNSKLMYNRVEIDHFFDNEKRIA
ncbi:DUF1233 family excisionase [Photobacterium carnosum]|uniref:excisionase family protein n=1 Tax=Photobacterium carnosum TaxID=2023717 RepID=UPI001C91BFCF|nr:excisionase family protein [Photobacterium carnosum]MBY3789532.1 DUF1233 family excisionase [Photobacterium carnosum]MCD9514002.1 hypothetical protein [Photobacterium carnosum]MCD9534591.1 hypothetical protein [Photobacterium carnosum]